MIGIYKITNLRTLESYIGQSLDIENRFKEHINHKNSTFSDQEAIELRKRYVHETAKQIYDSVKDRCSFQTLQCILWGRYYSHLKIYDKKEKKWK